MSLYSYNGVIEYLVAYWQGEGLTDLSMRNTCRMLVDLVRQRNVKFLVGQTMRFDRQFMTLRKMYEDGADGVITYALKFQLVD